MLIQRTVHMVSCYVIVSVVVVDVLDPHCVTGNYLEYVEMGNFIQL